MKRIKSQDPTELNWIKADGGQEARLRYLLKLLAAKRISDIGLSWFLEDNILLSSD
jgi:hypothetical protein